MVFYKYAGDSGIRVIEDLRLKITPPNEFNDPFELTPRSKFTVTVDEMLARLNDDPEWFRRPYERMVEDRGYPHNFERFLADMPHEIPRKFDTFKKLGQSTNRQADLKSVHDASDHMGILCLSKLRNSIAMWSYYANNHRGVVFGLDLSQPCFHRGLGSSFGAVKYRQNRCAIDPRLPEGPELLKQFTRVIFTKSTIWKHEQEYRRVYRLNELLHSPAENDGKRHYFLNIDGGAVREVILGCCIDPSYEQKVRAELNRKPKTLGHVRLLRCQRHPTRFEIQIVPA